PHVTALPHPPSFPTRRSSDLPSPTSTRTATISHGLGTSIPRTANCCGSGKNGSADDFARVFPQALRHREAHRDEDGFVPRHLVEDRKSTRLHSSHQIISYAVF